MGLLNNSTNKKRLAFKIIILFFLSVNMIILSWCESSEDEYMREEGQRIEREEQEYEDELRRYDENTER